MSEHSASAADLHAPPRRRFPGGWARPPRGAAARVVDRLVIHGGFVDAQALLDAVITPRTRYLVLDLDRTFHLGLNLGEMLGWDLAAVAGYGVDYLERVDSTRGPQRFLWAPERPLAAARYLWRGGRRWLFPGLAYFVAAKVARPGGALERLLYRARGGDPVAAAQHFVRVALMHHLAEVPIEVARQLVRRLWSRHAGDQVLQPSHIEHARARAPGLRVIVSSASPQPVLEVARELLGVDDVIYTDIEQRDRFLSAPHLQDPLYLMLTQPRRIAPPATFFENARFAKVRRLFERYPDMRDPDVEVVGISDTGHGEDYDWANFFTRVVDINSPSPFAPLVASDSPLREIHSAHVLTESERATRAGGDATYVDPRRRGDELPPARTRRYEQHELERELAEPLHQLSELARRHDEAEAALAEQLAPVERELRAVDALIDSAVAGYNGAGGRERRAIEDDLRGHLRQRKRLLARRAQLERPLAALSLEVTAALRQARAQLDPSQ